MSNRKKIFFLLSRVPYPIEKGDKLRAFHQIKELSLHYDIYLFALTDKPINPEAKKVIENYCKEVHIVKLSKTIIFFNLLRNLFFSKLPLQVAYFYFPFAKNKIEELVQKIKPDHLFCQLVRMSEYVKDISTPKTIDYMDALSRGMERRINKVPFYLKPFLKIETRRLKLYEHDIFSFFENRIIISEQDKNLIVHPENNRINVIENGVDFEYFKPSTEAQKKYDIIFTGNMSYPPNIDAAKYLIQHIMPNVWKIKKEIRVVIAGANPTKEIVKLKSDKVEITGWVDNMTQYYNASKIFVAPMQLGSGLQNKLLEAMAVKLPCITSTLANNALGAENNKEILIAKNVEDYTTYILQLIENETFYNSIANKGYQYIFANYSWKNAALKISNLIEKI